MLNLIIGAAASGKSEYAEAVVTALPGEKIYIATMEPFGPEAEARIARHRALREGKGFRTIERPRNLSGMAPEADWNVLIEDLPNLAANEFFSPEGGGAVAVLKGVDWLCKISSSVTIVTGDIFSDGVQYDVGTRAYMEMLADLHAQIAAEADNVAEVICGIPYAVKGELPVNRADDKILETEVIRQERSHKGGPQTKGMFEQGRLHVYVTGPADSGKREYVLRTLGIPKEEAAFEVQVLLRENPDLDEVSLAEKLSGFHAVTQSEVGAGVIPLSAEDREWREKAGRLACLLAARADIVVRMVCGIPVYIRQ